MTDEKIIALAEKTKKEKYCKMYLRDSTEKPYECDLDCPFNYDGMNCEDEYETAFLDGFKAAMEYFNQIIKKLNTDDKFDDDFNYYGGYKRAFRDIQEELGMEYDKD